MLAVPQVLKALNSPSVMPEVTQGQRAKHLKL